MHVLRLPAAAFSSCVQPALLASFLLLAPAMVAAETIAPPLFTSPHPASLDASVINSGDTAWLLSATALVLLMTLPGLALFYTGMVRRKNALTTMAHSFVSACVASLVWIVIGYSLAFTPGSPFLGGLDRLMLDGLGLSAADGTVTVHPVAPTIPESVFLMFQMTFAIITPALITGAFAERMKFSAVVLFVALWSLLVYAPVAHWVWAPGGWLSSHGVLDFAGGTVVHINAGVSGLIAAVILGPRIGFGREAMPPHNLLLTITGAALLWVGWFGFNAGSALAADGRAGMAMLVTQAATATAALSWMALEWMTRGKPSVLGLVTGAVCGMVAITPASGFVGISGALVIGAVSSIICYWAVTSLKSMLGYDDTLDVFGVHAVAGIVGAVLTGVFAVESIGGVQGNVASQLYGVVVTVLYSGVMTAGILGFIALFVGLRVPLEHEREGLDLSVHGEKIS